MTASSPGNPIGRTFAFAGLCATVPGDLHLAAVEGSAAGGRVRLADEEAVRLELAWVTLRRPPKRPDHACRRALKRIERKRRRRPTEDDLDALDLPGFAAAAAWKNPRTGWDHAVAHCPLTGRFLRAAWGAGEDRPDLLRTLILPNARFQPDEEPQRWAFFNVAFTAPAELVYHSSRLNLGDLAITLADRKQSRHLTVRFLYPAELALKRQDLHAWLDDLAARAEPAYRKPRRSPVHRHASNLGEALETDSRLRGGLLTPWRKRRCRRTRLLHHIAGNRLIALDARARKADLGTLLDDAERGLDPKERT